MSTPVLGQFYDSKLPPARKPTDSLAYFQDVQLLDYTFADTTATITIQASATYPVYLLEVTNLMTAALSGGTATVDVGDGTTVGKYIANTSITEATVGDLVRSVVGAKLTANAKVVVTIGAGNTAGGGTLIVKTFRAAPALPVI